ncbi:MAG TPA: hypothetical protein VHM01_21990 [Alphaproteobacteria bacterium]|nr:hypothetical protein [Alphaproteobacteria bacterium]
MRRGYVLCAMIAMAFGGYAEAAFDSPPSNLVLSRIQSFIADQRRADAVTCTALGVAEEGMEACIRNLAAQRRARLDGPAPADLPALPAGKDI